MKEKLTLIMPCHFGMEKIAKNEIMKLGLAIKEVSDGEVKAYGTFEDIAKLNINLRTCERVLIEVGNFFAKSFDELYQNILNIELEKFLPHDANFIITKANQDKNSIIHSSSSIQSIVKKAMVDRLKKAYKIEILNEEGKKFPFRVKFQKNNCSLRLDTTGKSLHMRGYRIKSSDAPIEETLAASIIMLTHFNKDRFFLDPFCGSGTFAIEAAMISANMAPNIYRAFISETWNNLIDKKVWKDNLEEAEAKIDKDILNRKEIKIFASDISPKMISIAKDNAKRAGIEKMISFNTSNVSKVVNTNKYGFLITNPPYGERLSTIDMPYVYSELRKLYDRLDSWSMLVITSYEDCVKYLKKEDKNRKIYNGMIKTYLYQYFNEYKK